MIQVILLPLSLVSSPLKVRDEIFMSLSCLPLAFMDLRLPISQLVSVSDASEQGGGICASQDLSPDTLGRSTNFFTSTSIRPTRRFSW
jgi:hypothetical protein